MAAITDSETDIIRQAIYCLPSVSVLGPGLSQFNMSGSLLCSCSQWPSCFASGMRTEAEKRELLQIKWLWQRLGENGRGRCCQPVSWEEMAQAVPKQWSQSWRSLSSLSPSSS